MKGVRLVVLWGLSFLLLTDLACTTSCQRTITHSNSTVGVRKGTNASEGTTSGTSTKKPDGQSSLTPNKVDPLTKVSPEELGRIVAFAKNYYVFRIHQESLETRDILNSGVLKSYLAPTFSILGDDSKWYMIVVSDRFSVGKVELYENGDLGNAPGSSTEVLGDAYIVPFYDERVGYVVNDRFVPVVNRKIDETRIAVVVANREYRIETDSGFWAMSEYPIAGTSPTQYKTCVSSLVVFQEDLPVFLQKIQPWYREMSPDDIWVPAELRTKQ